MWLGRGGTVKLGKEANKQALKKKQQKKQPQNKHPPKNLELMWTKRRL